MLRWRMMFYDIWRVWISVPLQSESSHVVQPPHPPMDFPQSMLDGVLLWILLCCVMAIMIWCVWHTWKSRKQQEIGEKHDDFDQYYRSLNKRDMADVSGINHDIKCMMSCVWKNKLSSYTTEERAAWVASRSHSAPKNSLEQQLHEHLLQGESYLYESHLHQKQEFDVQVYCETSQKLSQSMLQRVSQRLSESPRLEYDSQRGSMRVVQKKKKGKGS